MNDYPLIMTDVNVVALLAHRKRQTRRLPSPNNCLVDGSWDVRLFKQLDFQSPEIFVDEGPSPVGNPGPYLHVPHQNGESRHRVYPIWDPGDRVWIREAFCNIPIKSGGMGVAFRADGEDAFADMEEGYEWLGKWRSPIYLPRKLSRITREIERIRIERLKEISMADVLAEGCILSTRKTEPLDYQNLWESLHGKDSWSANPWVFVLKFKLL